MFLFKKFFVKYGVSKILKNFLDEEAKEENFKKIKGLVFDYLIKIGYDISDFSIFTRYDLSGNYTLNILTKNKNYEFRILNRSIIKI